MAVIVVTGGASGIGKAVTAACLKRGDQVLTVDIKDADFVGDLSTPAGRAEIVAKIQARVGMSLDGVIACAGLSPSLFNGNADVILGVNYFGAAAFVTALRPLLANGAAPRAVVISSEALIMDVDQDTIDACLVGDEDIAKQAALAKPEVVYQSSKRALSLWVKREAVTEDWAGRNILLNAVAPGVVDTPMIASLLSDPEGWEFLNKVTPMRLGRPAQAAEIAQLVAFLAGPENSFIVGQTIFCDGGAEATRRPTHL